MGSDLEEGLDCVGYGVPLHLCSVSLFEFLAYNEELQLSG